MVVLFFGILTNQGYAFSPACPSQTKPYRYAIKSFSSGKYLRVNGDNASDTLRVSFTGHFNACDTRIREFTFVLLLIVIVFSLGNLRQGSHGYVHKP